MDTKVFKKYRLSETGVSEYHDGGYYLVREVDEACAKLAEENRQLREALRNLVAGGRIEACINEMPCKSPKIGKCSACRNLDFCIMHMAQKDLQRARAALSQHTGDMP